jgi:hypothetical protein
MPSVPALDALILSALFGGFGVWQLAGPNGLRRTYRRWRFPVGAHRVIGVVAMIVAAFLADPITRIWGVILGALVCFVAVITLLNHRRYILSLPGIAVLVALVPASLAGPLG